MKQDIRGKTALITGASTGIGKDIAIRLSNLGVNVILCARRIEALEETKALCAKDVDVQVFKMDMCDEKNILEVVSKVEHLDYLINNAGVAEFMPFEETPTEVFDYVYSINVRGPFILSKAVLPLLRKSEVPTIINVGSVVSNIAYEEEVAYCSSKHALLGMTKVMAKELIKEDIRVHILCPGGVTTEMVLRLRPDLANIPTMVPEDMSDIVEFWLTHRSNAVIDQINVHRCTKEPFQV